MADIASKYVKFFRGTPKAFSILTHKDEDTLYFIAEKDSNVGNLYLGETLISSSIDGPSAVNKLAELTDVDLSNAVDKTVLTYIESTGKWMPMDVTTLVNTMVGATESSPSIPGLVPVAKSGDLNKFLRGDGTWATVEGAGGLITSVDASKFTVTEGKLLLNTLSVGDVGNLQELLDKKVDAIEGWSLLSPTDKAKLDALVVDGGNIELSGKVDAANVEGLGDWITQNRSSVIGLYPVADSNKLAGIEAGAQVNVINSVDTTYFTVNEVKELQLNDIPAAKVTGLSELQSTVAKIPETYVSIANFNKVVGNLDTLLNSRTTTMEQDIKEIKQSLIWQELSE